VVIDILSQLLGSDSGMVITHFVDRIVIEPANQTGDNIIVVSTKAFL
jgi:hypothetical protein